MLRISGHIFDSTNTQRKTSLCETRKDEKDDKSCDVSNSVTSVILLVLLGRL